MVPNNLTLVSGGSGTGNGTVILSAPPNTGFDHLTYVPQIGPVRFPVTVAENCTYALSPLNAPGEAGGFVMDVTASSTACTWSVTSDAAWLPLTGYGYSNDGAAGSFETWVSANATGAPRVAHVYIGSQVFTVTQAVNTATLYTVNVVVHPRGTGTVSGGGLQTSPFAALIATPNRGWAFAGWSPDMSSQSLSNSSPYLPLNLTGDLTITANFAPCRACRTEPACVRTRQ